MFINTILRSLIVLLLLGGVVTSAQAADFTIKFSSIAPDGTPWAERLKEIKKRIEKESGGRIKMKLFLGGSLGGEVEMVRALRRGRIQGWGGSTAAIAEGAGISQFQLMELPFLFESFEEADFVLDEVIHEDFVKILNDKGFAFAQWHENGWRNFATKKTGITTLEQLQGLKMRSQESPVHLAMYKALGIQAESISAPEVLSALQTGMVDGFDNTPLFSAATGWYEGIKQYIVSRHIYQPALIVYSEKFLATLPADLRKIVLGNWRDESVTGRASIRIMREELLANFREVGIIVTELSASERQRCEELTHTVHQEFEATVGKALLQKVYAARKVFRAKAGK